MDIVMAEEGEVFDIELEKNKCLEIIAVKGSAQEVKSLTQVLMAKKGVKQVKVAAMAP